VAGPTFDGEDLDLICWDGWPQDAALIAAMRNDLPLLLDVVELAAEVMADDGLPWRPEYGCFFCPATNAPHEDGCLWAETKAALAALGGAA